jgi:UDP-glucose 4-epimerase
MMIMRALVTGAAGFIGSTLVDRLLGDGHTVTAVDNLSTGSLDNLDAARRGHRLHRQRFTFVRSDIGAPELEGIVAGSNPHVIFHLAAQVSPRASAIDPQFDARTNVLGTVNVLEAARRADVRRVVYAASGGSRYRAAGAQHVGEAGPASSMSPCAVSKLAGEMYMRAYADMHGISPICLALADVYGPRQNEHGEAGVITAFGRAMIADRTATFFGDGADAHEYVYVDDVVDAFVRAANAPRDSAGTYEIGTGQLTSVIEVHRLIAAALGSHSSRAGAAAAREWRAAESDATKTQIELGWRPAVELVDGIERTIHWLRTDSNPEYAALVGA